MQYDMTITIREMNPNYKEEIKTYNEGQKYGTFNQTVIPIPQQWISKKELFVTLNSRQFEVIKKAVIETIDMELI